MPKRRYEYHQHTGDGEHQVTEKPETVTRCTEKKAEDRVTSLVAQGSSQLSQYL